jgi:hypothetical protein
LFGDPIPYAQKLSARYLSHDVIILSVAEVLDVSQADFARSDSPAFVTISCALARARADKLCTSANVVSL